MIRCLGIMAALLALAGCATERPTEPGADAKSIVADVGDQMLTAKLTHFDYLGNLKLAAAKNDAGLRNLFRFTDTEAFIGAGADDHCDTLRKLLFLWGDREYARVLSGESQKVREAVISAIDYTGGTDTWNAKYFPRTYSLAKHAYDDGESSVPDARQ